MEMRKESTPKKSHILLNYSKNANNSMHDSDPLYRCLTSKMGGGMKKDRLRKAAEIAMQEIANSSDDELIKEHVFSDEFEEQIRRNIILSANIYNRKRRRQLLTLALSVVIFITMTFVYGPEVRAKAKRLLKYVLGEDVIYEFDSSSSESTCKYVISGLPEGYTIISESFDGIIGTGVYGNDSNVLILMYESISEQGKIEVYASGNPGEINIIDGVEYEYFEGVTSGEQNTIVWTNPEETVLFTLSSDLDLESMVNIAESVKIEE